MTDKCLSIGEIIAFIEDEDNVENKDMIMSQIDSCERCFRNYVRLSSPKAPSDTEESLQMPQEVENAVMEHIQKIDGTSSKKGDDVLKWPLGDPKNISNSNRESSPNSDQIKWPIFLTSMTFIVILFLSTQPAHWEMVADQYQSTFRDYDKENLASDIESVGEYVLDQKGIFSYKSSYKNPVISLRTRDAKELFSKILDKVESKIDFNEILKDYAFSKVDTFQLVIKHNRLIIFESRITRR